MTTGETKGLEMSKIMNIRKNASSAAITAAQDQLLKQARATGEMRYLSIGGVVAWGVDRDGRWSWGDSTASIDGLICGQQERELSR